MDSQSRSVNLVSCGISKSLDEHYLPVFQHTTNNIELGQKSVAYYYDVFLSVLLVCVLFCSN